MICKHEKLVDSLIDVLIALMLIAYLINYMFMLWQYRVFGVGVSSLLIAGATAVFWIYIFYWYKNSLTVFELFIAFLVIGLGMGAHSYGENRWFLSLPVYQSFFALGLGVIMMQRRIKDWVFVAPLVVALGFFVISLIIRKSVDIAIVMPKINQNTFAMLIIACGLLGSLNIFLQKIWNYSLFVLFSSLTLLLSFFSKSRAAIIVSLGYFAFILGLVLVKLVRVAKLNKSLKKYFRFGLFFILSLIVLFVVLFYSVKETRLGSSGLDGNGRTEVYMSFLSAYTWKSIFIGVPSSALKGYAHYHNSFFQVLGTSGLLGWATIVLYLITGVYLLKKKEVFLVAIFGLISIYSLVEPYMFLGLGDLVLFPIFIFTHRLIKNSPDLK